MALNTPSCHQGLTPPNSPTKESTIPLAALKDLMHLFGVFLENALLDLTDQEPPNTPISQDHSPPSPDMVRLKQLLVNLTSDGCALAELSMAAKPDHSCPASNELEDIAVADGTDLKHAISTTPDDFKLFEKWASTPSFKAVVETYEPPANLPF
jgi:hypothetical protein